MPVIDGTYMILVSGSNGAPPHSAPPIAPGICIVPLVPPSLLIDGGVKIGPMT